MKLKGKHMTDAARDGNTIRGSDGKVMKCTSKTGKNKQQIGFYFLRGLREKTPSMTDTHRLCFVATELEGNY